MVIARTASLSLAQSQQVLVFPSQERVHILVQNVSLRAKQSPLTWTVTTTKRAVASLVRGLFAEPMGLMGRFDGGQTYCRARFVVVGDALGERSNGALGWTTSAHPPRGASVGRGTFPETQWGVMFSAGLGIGLALAEALAQRSRARLVLEW